jgi:hypothetical protein
MVEILLNEYEPEVDHAKKRCHALCGGLAIVG